MNTVVVIALSLLAADGGNLKEITRNQRYIVAVRDGRCLDGRLVLSATLKREDVLRISNVPYPSAQFSVYRVEVRG